MTSIEWLFEQLDITQGYESAIELLNQAKEMHKQEIIDAYDKGEFDCGCNGSAEQYYKEIFKKN